MLHGAHPTFQQECCITRNIKTALRLSMYCVCVRTCVLSSYTHKSLYNMLPCLYLKQRINSAPQASWHSPVRRLCPISYFLSKIRIRLFNCEVVKHERSLQGPAVLGDNSQCQPHVLPIRFFKILLKIVELQNLFKRKQKSILEYNYPLYSLQCFFFPNKLMGKFWLNVSYS